MRRTGNARRWSAPLALALLGLVLARPARAAGNDTEIYQTSDRGEVGQQDTFNVTVVVTNAPDGATVQFPTGTDFETVRRSESQETQIQFINGRFAQKASRKYTLTMHPLKVGTLKVPPAVLVMGGRSLKTDALNILVRKGHVSDPGAQQRQRQAQDPFAAMGFPPMPDPFGRGGPGGGQQQPIDVDDDGQNIPDVNVPNNDSDLFLRTVVDKNEVFVGEQLTLSVYVYSRVDLSAVDPQAFPKTDGFWAEDIDSPTNLAPEQKVLEGRPYRVYLIKRRAMFPVKGGTFTIGGAEADITTGYLFAGRRVHREGNSVTVKVKPLPSGAPAGFAPANVGAWTLRVEASPTNVELGSPVNVKVSVEGRGNVRDLIIPKLTAPASVRVFDPTTNDRVQSQHNKVVGKRTQEYVVMPQQTGSFTLPALALSYFDPEQRRYLESRADALAITVTPGSGGATSLAGTPGASTAASGPKNILNAGGLRPVRYSASFEPPGQGVWRRPYFIPLAVLPPLAWALLGAWGFARGRLSREDEGSASRRKLKAARGRLDAAEQLRASGTPAAFYGEVERALSAFLEAKLGVPVIGLTREALTAQMTTHAVPAALQQRVRSALDGCDLGRFAPSDDGSARARVLDDAAAVMEGWGES